MPIRTATRNDLPAILEIYNEAVLHTTATYDYAPQMLDQRQAWFDRLQAGGFPVVVAVDERDQALAWGALNPFHSKPGYRFTTENSVYVSPQHRGQGLGKQVLQALIEAGQARQFRSIIALIDSQATVSLRLHTSLGFEKVAHLKAVGYKFERWLDVIYMQRMLGE